MIDPDIARFHARVAAGALLELAARGMRDAHAELVEAEDALHAAADVYEGARGTFGEWVARARRATELYDAARRASSSSGEEILSA